MAVADWVLRADSGLAFDRRLAFLGGARQALAVDARRVREDVRGP